MQVWPNLPSSLRRYLNPFAAQLAMPELATLRAQQWSATLGKQPVCSAQTPQSSPDETVASCPGGDTERRTHFSAHTCGQESSIGMPMGCRGHLRTETSWLRSASLVSHSSHRRTRRHLRPVLPRARSMAVECCPTCLPLLTASPQL